MELKEATERIVIVKPIASRPTTSSSSNFRSFSELLASANSVSPSYETAATAIRPKTLRFKPPGSCPPLEDVSYQAEIAGTQACHSSDKVLKSNSNSTLVYKPLAKMVSNTTVSLLANMGNSDIGHQQALLGQVEPRAETSNKVNQHLIYNPSTNLYQNFSSPSETDKAIDPPKTQPEILENDEKSLPHTSTGDRPSYDGYNWRKYGQKQVKGSEYPRSYYKCTYPNCPVKKKVERSMDGEIAEIVYKGEHNHSKPPLMSRCNTSGGQGQDSNYRVSTNELNVRNEGFEGSMENQNEVFGPSSRLTNLGKAPRSYDPGSSGVYSANMATLDDSCGVNGNCEELTEAEGDEPKSKRRKNVNQFNEAVIYVEGIHEPRVVVRGATDSDVVADGFRWRKYGQKVVKGNPYPRSYYRCTGLKCNVRKHVERASDDPGTFITTYEGKHNHEMPIKNTNPVPSEPDSKAR